MSALSVTLEKSLGWFGDVIAQHHYRDDEPMPMRRRWSFDGPGFDITDDDDNQVSRFALTNDALYPAVPDQTTTYGVAIWAGGDGSQLLNGDTLRVFPQSEEDPDSGAVLVTSHLAISGGNVEAQSGTVRMHEDSSIMARAGLIDVHVIGTLGTIVSVGAAGATALELTADGIPIRAYGPLVVNAGADNHPSTGDIRLGSLCAIRGHGGAGTIDVLELDAASNVWIGGQDLVNRPSAIVLRAAGATQMYSGNTLAFLLGAGTLQYGIPDIYFAASTISPNFYQANDTTASATGDTLTVRAQTCTGAGSVGGDVFIKPGAGTSANGQGRLRTADNLDLVMWGVDGDKVTISAGPGGAERIRATEAGVTISTIEGPIISISGDELGFFGSATVPRQFSGSIDLSSLGSGVVRNALVALFLALGSGSGYNLIDDSGVTYP